MVSHIDLFPTICDLLDIERPSWLQGKSMMPLVRGTAQEINDDAPGVVPLNDGFLALLADGVRVRLARYVWQGDVLSRSWVEGDHASNLYAAAATPDGK